MKLKRFQTPINGYSDEGQVRKNAFMAACAKFLKAIGKKLALDYGMTEIQIRKNAAGIACAGDVYAEIYKPGAEYGVYITMGADVGVGLGREGDGIHLMTRWIEKTPQPRHSQKNGPNVWLRPTRDAEDMAVDIYSVLERHEAAVKQNAKPHMVS